MIHVCYAIYDPNGTYSKFIGTSICSLFENTREAITIHILHDDTLNKENRQNFIKLADKYHQTINFFPIELDDTVNEFMKSFNQSPATLYRLNIGNVLPKSISKVIYLDADTVVNMDIKNLWEELDEEYILGAVLDTGVAKLPNAWRFFPIIPQGYVKREDYFNAGVLIINLNKLRNIDNFYLSTIELFRNNLKFFVGHDQDLLNYLFSKQYKKISNDYNRQLGMEKNMGLKNVGNAIYHYINHGLGINLEDEFDNLFWHYFIKTPWFNEKFMLVGFRNFQLESLNRLSTNLSSLLKALYTRETRIFWSSQKLFDSLMELLKQMKIYEGIWLANGEESIYEGGGY